VAGLLKGLDESDRNFGGRSKAYGRAYSRRDVQAGSAGTCYCRGLAARTLEMRAIELQEELLKGHHKNQLTRANRSVKLMS